MYLLPRGNISKNRIIISLNLKSETFISTKLYSYGFDNQEEMLQKG